MEKHKFISLLFMLAGSCGPFPDIKPPDNLDLTPPVLEGLQVTGESTVEMTFNEPVCLNQEAIAISPLLELESLQTEANRVLLTMAIQEPGNPYLLEADITDLRGNGTNLNTTFYGFNASVPKLLINEFTPRGSGNNPDILEIRVITPGNMGGVTLYQGTPSNWSDRFIFPVMEVREGDYLLLHFKPEGLPDELNETEYKDQSGGLGASEWAFDFWLPGGTGISGNNGVLSLYPAPGSTNILDGVLYSNRTSASDTEYNGFGTRNVMERAAELGLHEGWISSEGGALSPEDGINPENSTGTRSLCRDSLGSDTDRNADWHTVPTRGATFGWENSDTIYIK